MIENSDVVARAQAFLSADRALLDAVAVHGYGEKTTAASKAVDIAVEAFEGVLPDEPLHLLAKLIVSGKLTTQDLEPALEGKS